MAEPFKIDKNGTKYYYDYTCPRCGGAGGSDKWQFTGWKCYDCGGSGKRATPIVYKVYTPEYQAKLDERRAKRQAKREAELKSREAEIRAEWLAKNQFDKDGFTYLFKGDTYSHKDDIKATGAKFDYALGWHIAAPVNGYDFAKVSVNDIATPTLYGYNITATKDYIDQIKETKQENPNTSDYIGEIGERITFSATYTNRAFWENNYIPWHPQTTYCHEFTTADGNVLIWKTSNGLALNIGDKITVTGTIKEHSEYNEVKQTVLTRCKVEEGKE